MGSKTNKRKEPKVAIFTKSKFWKKTKYLVPLMVITFLAVTGGAISSNAKADSQSWGPQDRPTFTWAEPAEYVTFNSITDNPKIGDERNFVRIRKANTEDELLDDVNLEVGQEYEVSIWFHNNAKAKLNDRENGGVGIATDVRLSIEQPEIVQGGTNAVIKGTISSTNAKPTEVWDEAFAYTDSTVLLRYVANSATIHSLGDIDGSILSSEAMFSDEGAKLGYWKDMWGTLPGCNEFSGYVTYHFVVDQAGFEIQKTVSKEGENNFSEKLTVNPGDVLDFKIDYKNTGTINQLSIIGYDTLPEGFSYIEGSSYFTANFNEEGNSVSDKLFDGGINLGDFKPGDSMSLTYKVKVSDDPDAFPCGDTVVYNDAKIATENGTGSDKAEITVHRDCEKTCVTNPEMPECQELPSTGPVEVVIALVIIAGIGGGGYYFYRTRKALRTVKSSVSGDGGTAKHVTESAKHVTDDAKHEVDSEAHHASSEHKGSAKKD